MNTPANSNHTFRVWPNLWQRGLSGFSLSRLRLLTVVVFGVLVIGTQAAVQLVGISSAPSRVPMTQCSEVLQKAHFLKPVSEPQALPVSLPFAWHFHAPTIRHIKSGHMTRPIGDLSDLSEYS